MKNSDLLIGLFNVFAPIVQHAIEEHRAATGTEPTLDDLKAWVVANADRYIAEGTAWKATHPHV